jgi:predicted nucleic acid-binding protein
LTRAIVLDTDFLSAFLKIGRLQLIRDFYQADTLLVPAAVIAELSRTPLLQDLARIPWIRIEAVGHEFPDDPLHRLGRGEREAIALAARDDSLLLTNDNLARQAARRAGVESSDIPAFLLSCKITGFLDGDGVREIVRDLREKDHYGFRKEILDRLIS